jgi:hypothetical protein
LKIGKKKAAHGKQKPWKNNSRSKKEKEKKKETMRM